MNAVYLALSFFAFAVILGMYLISFVLEGKKPPRIIVFILGPSVVFGLAALVLYSTNQGGGFVAPIVLLSIAAASGLMLFTFDFTESKIPRWAAISNGFAAGTGFIVLLFYAF